MAPKNRLNLFDFFDWSDRAEKLGFRLQKFGSNCFALRRESDGELMTGDLTCQEAVELIEQLEQGIKDEG
jgi:hypothetical protein